QRDGGWLRWRRGARRQRLSDQPIHRLAGQHAHRWLRRLVAQSAAPPARSRRGRDCSGRARARRCAAGTADHAARGGGQHAAGHLPRRRQSARRPWRGLPAHCRSRLGGRARHAGGVQRGSAAGLSRHDDLRGQIHAGTCRVCIAQWLGRPDRVRAAIHREPGLARAPAPRLAACGARCQPLLRWRSRWLYRLPNLHRTKSADTRDGAGNTMSRDDTHPGLWALVVTAFAIGVTEFIVVGVLPAIATDLDVPLARAGGLVGLYALALAIGTPLVVLGLARLPRKPVLLALVAVFLAGNLLSALSTSYPMLLAGRVITAVAHGSFFA